MWHRLLLQNATIFAKWDITHNTSKSDRHNGSFSTLNDLSNKVCVPNKTEDLMLSMFNMIAAINESKELTRHISCKCKCKIVGIKYNSG